MTRTTIGFDGRLTLEMNAGRPMAIVAGRSVLGVTTLPI
jgi:hypothetical protein